MINTHRDYLVQGLSLFCKKNTFIDIKIQNQTYLLPKIHFTAQLILGLKFLGYFEDSNSIISNLENISLEQFLISEGNELIQQNSKSLFKPRRDSASKEAVINNKILSSFSDIGEYQVMLDSRRKNKSGDLRYFLIQDIYNQTSSRDCLRAAALAKKL